MLQFLEGCLGFDCPLVVAAVGQFVFGAAGLNGEEAGALNEFQKSLAYGLPSKLSVSAHESGLADRHIAQDVAIDIWLAGYEGSYFRAALSVYREVVAKTLSSYPAYFGAVLDSLCFAGRAVIRLRRSGEDIQDGFTLSKEVHYTLGGQARIFHQGGA